jgi:pSer/pThr/pTyr-binding forkhead associated (FHA) protein
MTEICDPEQFLDDLETVRPAQTVEPATPMDEARRLADLNSCETIHPEDVDVIPPAPIVAELGESIRPADAVGILVIRCTPQRVRLGDVFRLKTARTVIGSGREATIPIQDPDVARSHACIECKNNRSTGSFVLYPTAHHPSWINGNLIGSATVLRNGDALRFGNSELVFFQVEFRKDLRP